MSCERSFRDIHEQVLPPILLMLLLMFAATGAVANQDIHNQSEITAMTRKIAASLHATLKVRHSAFTS